MRVKTAEETAKRVRTGVGWMGLLRKLYEQREVRVLYDPPIHIKTAIVVSL